MEPMEVTEVTRFHSSNSIKEPSARHSGGGEQYFEYYYTCHIKLCTWCPSDLTEPHRPAQWQEWPESKLFWFLFFFLCVRSKLLDTVSVWLSTDTPPQLTWADKLRTATVLSGPHWLNELPSQSDSSSAEHVRAYSRAQHFLSPSLCTFSVFIFRFYLHLNFCTFLPYFFNLLSQLFKSSI